MKESPAHPCLSCGACCAFFRVSFYWREAEPAEGARAVPLALTENYSPWLRTMQGTTQKHRCRCVALAGKVGEQVSCTIYERRPSPCREFQASFEDGVHRARCDQARAQYGMAALVREDWAEPSGFARGGSAGRLYSHETKKSAP